MAPETIALASDHAGFELKEILKEDLQAMGQNVLDLGTNSLDSVDYPDFGRALAEAIADGRAQLGIAVCGSGIGISIAANRNPAVRAALCHDALTARLSRQHNDANVLALGSRVIGVDTAKDCLRVFLETEFEGGRHAARVEKLG
jgi:ribose 5-phosphate isomerase B